MVSPTTFQCDTPDKGVLLAGGEAIGVSLWLPTDVGGEAADDAAGVDAESFFVKAVTAQGDGFFGRIGSFRKLRTQRSRHRVGLCASCIIPTSTSLQSREPDILSGGWLSAGESWTVPMEERLHKSSPVSRQV